MANVSSSSAGPRGGAVAAVGGALVLCVACFGKVVLPVGDMFYNFAYAGRLAGVAGR